MTLADMCREIKGTYLVRVTNSIYISLQDILKQAMEDNLSSAAELPYFEGDFWPNVLEESIKELDQEEEEKRRQAEAAEAAAAAAAASTDTWPENVNEV